ncbi:MAG: nitrile hydratase subunit beta [Rhodospirillaceae bacterium]|nr:nitrile hydratase subunit beta [Rhodospirillaceae bacterium]
MNSIHDMGGLTCFGQVKYDEDEPVFHHEWEQKVLAITVATSSLFGPLDKRRHVLEKIGSIDYLKSSYYERWLIRLELSLNELTAINQYQSTESEYESIDFKELEHAIYNGRPSDRTEGRQTPIFSVGDRIRTKNINPSGHTRLARYVRGRCGFIDRVHGTHSFPDTAAHGEGENPQPLYSVRFTAKELWGAEKYPTDNLYIDLWEDYLEPLDV